MEWLVALILATFLGYLIYEEVTEKVIIKPIETRGRLCDYYTGGAVWEPVEKALGRKVRLMEVHIYSDEQDQPVVGLKPLNPGFDYAEENETFESVCVAIANDAFPSSDPFILSIVPHTNKTIVMDRVAEHLQTTVRKHLFQLEGVHQAPLDMLANKLILVSSRTGSLLDPLLNMSWNDADLRRLSYQQALHPRDPKELLQFNKDHITLVAPDPELKTINANPDTPKALGCQWNLFDKQVNSFLAR